MHKVRVDISIQSFIYKIDRVAKDEAGVVDAKLAKPNYLRGVTILGEYPDRLTLVVKLDPYPESWRISTLKNAIID